LRRGLRRGFGSENAGGFQANRGMLPQSDLQNLQTEIDTIQSRAESMQRSLDAINERLTEMEKGK
jgi:predicted  nucleic acid-binding Zn-ribbon protein